MSRLEIRRRGARPNAGAVAAVALLPFLLFCAGSLLAQDDRHTPAAAAASDPTVTAREAELLQAVATASSTNPAGAISLLQKQDKAKASAALDFALGNLLYQAGNLAEAEQAYEAALAKLPSFRRARANLARVCVLQDKASKAVEQCTRVMQEGGTDAGILMVFAHALFLQGQAVSAEGAYRQALLLKPGDTDAMLGLARCLLDQQRHNECAGLLAEVLANDSSKPELWGLLANVRIALGQVDKATVALECARRLGTATPEMLATLGDLYLNAGQSDSAVRAYESAFALEKPSISRMLRAARGFVASGDGDRAAKFLSGLDEFFAKDAARFTPQERRDLLALKADVARVWGEPVAALAAYKTLLDEDPLNGAALLATGDLLRKQHKIEDAALAYERAARIRGSELQALVRHAQLEIERERYGRAVELLEAALAVDPQPHIARYLEQVRRLAN